MLFSLVYPFLYLPQLFEQPLVISQGYNYIMQGWPAATPPRQTLQPNYWLYLLLFFCGFSVLLLVRLFLRLFSLYRIHAKTTPSHYQRYRFRKVSLLVNPFSFWKTIYLNPNCHQAEELVAILRHEKVHTDELHTADVLVAEVLLLLCWFNPAMWLTTRAIIDNLEFITDQCLLQQGMDSKAYQYCLLKINKLSQASDLTTNFNFLTLKTRITMMNKKKSASMHMLKYALMLPLAIGLMYSCNFADEPAEGLLPKEPATTEQTLSEEATYYLDGKESDLAGVNQLKPEEIATVNVYKGEQAINRFGKKGEEGVVVVTTKKYSQTQRLKSPSPETDISKNNVRIKSSKDASTLNGNPPADAYVLIDGKEASMAEVELLSDNKIATVKVWKDKEAITRFGSKGEKGVISITTRK